MIESMYGVAFATLPSLPKPTIPKDSNITITRLGCFSCILLKVIFLSNDNESFEIPR